MINGATIKTGASYTPTGGSDVVLSADGRTTKNGISVVVASDAVLTRRKAIFTATLPSIAVNTSSYAKPKRNEVVVYYPFIAADGKLYTNYLKIQRSFHSEDTRDATALTDAIAIMTDSELSNFWTALLVV